MATKTTGAELKRFYSDESFWPADDGKTWHDDENLTVNGVVKEFGCEIMELNDDDAIIVDGGIVYGPKWTKDNEPSFEGYFKSWKKKQNTASFLVECPLDKVEAVKAAIRAAGGKVA